MTALDPLAVSRPRPRSLPGLATVLPLLIALDRALLAGSGAPIGGAES